MLERIGKVVLFCVAYIAGSVTLMIVKGVDITPRDIGGFITVMFAVAGYEAIMGKR